MPPEANASDPELDALLGQGGAGSDGNGDGLTPVNSDPDDETRHALSDWAHKALAVHRYRGDILRLEIASKAEALRGIVAYPLDACDATARHVATALGIADPFLEQMVDENADPAAGETRKELPSYTVPELLTREPEEVDWLWRPYVGRGDLISVEAPPKWGKTTFVLALVGAVAGESRFRVGKTVKGHVLYCTEERASSFIGGLKRTGADHADRLRIMLLHDAAYRMAWEEVVTGITRMHEAEPFDLVVFDTLSKWAGIAGDDEMSSGVAMRIMSPLQHLAALGPAVCVLRHERKAGGAVGEAGRGSNAFTGEVDTVLSVRRMAGEKTKRLLYAVGRRDETPDECVVELIDGVYHELGDPADVRLREDERQVLDALAYGRETARTIDEILDEVDLARSKVQRVLKKLTDVDGVVGWARGVLPEHSRAIGYWLREDA